MKGTRKESAPTFVFRVFPDGMPSVWRLIELKDRQTLHDLHKAIHHSFGLKGKHLYAFYLSGKRWDVDSEYGGPSVSTPRKAPKAILCKLKIEKGRPFLYLYNMDKENGFILEWTEARATEPNKTYPRVVEEVGEMPEEIPALEDVLPDPVRRWASKLRPVLEGWVLTRSKTRGPKDVQKAASLVKETGDFLKKHGTEIWPLMEEATGMLLVDWLLSLPEDFAKRGMYEEALALCDEFSLLADKVHFMSEKALVYSYMGHRERALKQIRENLTLSPDDPRIVTKAAEAFMKLEEAGHAERLLRKALDLAADDLNERERVLQKLTAMLEVNERTEEVAELIRSEMDRG